MTITTPQLSTAINTFETDTAVLHQILHGSETTTVTTESGPVDSVAKRLASTTATVNAAVTAYFAANPPTLGATTQAQLTSAVTAYLVANPPAPGRDPTAAEIMTAVSTYITANPPQAGQDGNPGDAGRPPTAAEILTAVDSYITANPQIIEEDDVVDIIREQEVVQFHPAGDAVLLGTLGGNYAYCSGMVTHEGELWACGNTSSFTGWIGKINPVDGSVVSATSLLLGQPQAMFSYNGTLYFWVVSNLYSFNTSDNTTTLVNTLTGLSVVGASVLNGVIYIGAINAVGILIYDFNLNTTSTAVNFLITDSFGALTSYSGKLYLVAVSSIDLSKKLYEVDTTASTYTEVSFMPTFGLTANQTVSAFEEFEDEFYMCANVSNNVYKIKKSIIVGQIPPEVARITDVDTSLANEVGAPQIGTDAAKKGLLVNADATAWNGGEIAYLGLAYTMNPDKVKFTRPYGEVTKSSLKYHGGVVSTAGKYVFMVTESPNGYALQSHPLATEMANGNVAILGRVPTDTTKVLMNFRPLPYQHPVLTLRNISGVEYARFVEGGITYESTLIYGYPGIVKKDAGGAITGFHIVKGIFENPLTTDFPSSGTAAAALTYYTTINAAILAEFSRNP